MKNSNRQDQLSIASDTVWAIGMTIGLSFTIIAATFFVYPESPSGKFWAYAGLLIRSSLYVWSGDKLGDRGGETLSRLFRMGLVAGLFEILIDWWLIHGVTSGQLIYMTGNDVVLLGSPIWMPVAWACVIVELAYPALRLVGLLKNKLGDKTAAVISTLVISVSAGITVGLYEYFAFRAGWWKYEPARVMIGPYCAAYIPVGEALMFLPVLPISNHMLSQTKHSTATVIESGAWFALSIAAGYVIAYGLLG